MVAALFLLDGARAIHYLETTMKRKYEKRPAVYSLMSGDMKREPEEVSKAAMFWARGHQAGLKGKLMTRIRYDVLMKAAVAARINKAKN